MRDLQADLDMLVFTRTRPKIALTPAGEQLAEQLSKAFRIVADATAEVRAPDAPLRLTVNPTFGSRWLTPRLRDLRVSSNVPRIIVDVSMQLRSIPEEADVAIRGGVGPWPNLACTLLMPIERTPMMSPELAARLEPPPEAAALRNLPLLYSADWTRWFEAAGLKFSKLEDTGEVYPSQDLLAQAVMAGSGVGLLSPRLFESLIRRGDIVAPFDTVLSGPDSHYAVYDPDRSHPASSELVRRLARSLSDGQSA